MTSSLFRPEALEHRKDRLYGDVILIQPLSMMVLVGAAVFICVFILAILFWGTYARKETVKGFLVPDKGIVRIYAYQPGTLARILVEEGDKVKEGQPLATILSERGLQGGENIETVKIKEVESTIAHKLETIKGEQELLVSEKASLEAQLNGLRKELIQLDQSIKNQEQRLQISEKRVQGAKKLLDKKNISDIEYQQLVEALLEQKQSYQNLVSSKGIKQSNLSQLQLALEQLPIRSKAKIADLENSISDLKNQSAEIKGHHTIEVRAPIGGLVTAINAKEGQFQTQQTPLLAIIPEGAVLQAELYLPSRAIGFISKGQTVRLRYEAFPYQRFGIYEGKISEISQHALLPAELSVPMEIKEPVYRIKVDLDKQIVMAYKRPISLQAGMSLDADIILEKRTLFQWILDPLFSLRGRF